MLDEYSSVQRIESLIRLVKKGDPASLTQLRQKLGIGREEIAIKAGVSESQLRHWELGEQQPSSIQHTSWKLRLSDYIDEEISELLGMDKGEIINQLWEIMWRLND